jgi:hypothetical protein
VYYLERLKRPLTAAEVTRLNKWTLQDEARLVVVVNSLWRVGVGAGYKVLIVDEAGLVRRHFVGATLAGGTKAAEAYDMVKRLVGRADKVLLLQEGLERGDVGFYTGMQGVDPEDRRYVKGYNFEKPIRVHDIEFSEDLYNILGPMLDRYTEMATKADSEERGGEASESDSDSVSDSDRRSKISQFEAPFLVLTSSLAFAEVLFEMLSECAATDERRGRIRLMTSRQRVQPQDDFDKKFGEEPDEWGVVADVIICTSVIGAGFSIEKHFTHFYAYFFNNILTHTEERQFLQRLRYWSPYIPEDVNKKSYMWVERSHVRGVSCDGNQVRDMYDQSAEVLLAECRGDRRAGPLEATELRVYCEKNHTRQYHSELWLAWGATVQSKYEAAPPYDGDKKAALVKRFSSTKKKRLSTVASMVIEETSSSDGLTAALGLDHENPVYHTLVRLVAESSAKTLKARVHHLDLLPVLTDLLKGKNKGEISVQSTNGIFTDDKALWIGNIWRLVNWTLRTSPNSGERLDLDNFWARYLHQWKNGPINITMEKQKSLGFLALMEQVITPLFVARPNPRPELPGGGEPYLIHYGEPPFFESLQFVANRELCIAFREQIRSKAQPSHYEALVQVCWNKGTSKKKDLEPLYTDPKTLYHFIKSVMKRVGLRCAGIRGGRENVYRVTPPVRDLAVAMCLRETRAIAFETLGAMESNASLWGRSQHSYHQGRDLYSETCNKHGVSPMLVPFSGGLSRNIPAVSIDGDDDDDTDSQYTGGGLERVLRYFYRLESEFEGGLRPIVTEQADEEQHESDRAPSQRRRPCRFIDGEALEASDESISDVTDDPASNRNRQRATTSRRKRKTLS